MPTPDHIQKAIQAYYAERATDEDIAALEAWFREDEAHIKIFAEHGMVEWQILCQQEKADAAAILAILREAEDNAEPDFSLLDTPAFEATPEKSGDDALSLQQVWSAASYAIGMGLRTKAATYASIAAVLVLGTVLYVSIFGLGSTPDPSGVADNTPTKPADSAPTIPQDQAVATLSATHNAKWAEGALVPGSPLRAGQQLTLTHGFAEITTKRGAIAILEAPAIIELTNSNNAIELHSGKLVGVCETDSSKGFVVRTAHMDITDIGTRFGAEVVRGQSTEVHVLHGEVALAREGLAGGVDSVYLSAGESAGSTIYDSRIVAIEHAPARFSNLLPKRALIAGTGRGLEAGQVDPNWQLIAINGKALDEPQAIKVTTGNEFFKRVFADDPSTSQLLAWDTGASEPSSDSPAYLVQTTIDLPASINEPGARLLLRYMADNELRSVLVNGQRVVLPDTKLNKPYRKYFETAISAHLVPGANTLVFEVINYGSTDIENPAGLRVAMYLEQPAWAEATP